MKVRPDPHYRHRFSA
jgi:putative transposase